MGAVPGDKEPHVYLIRDADGNVKIGTSHNVSKRLLQLQGSHAKELRVIGIIPHGGRRFERHLHNVVIRHGLNGEWFTWNREVCGAFHEALRDVLAELDPWGRHPLLLEVDAQMMKELQGNE